ncbi:MAG TPA: prephenate dehydrogenase/arogenate dehydrogenase family protein [Deltaproteobacteria bacterium]|nr:prephenate dehydrogenase/arogenate dehydrogenase family protein [Deltaproteobacteria bacterium]HPR51750.1 prephenate dehydrogenase/arogenate dehydrogenase family protein [Deltaproteobacteria bacterium]
MKIAIIGLGLIGASIAKALRGQVEITGIDTDQATIDRALQDGVIKQGGPDMSLADGSGMVVLAVPVGSIVQTAKRVIPHISKDTVITDTGSTKARIVREMDAAWPCFVGGHPIAGRENPGYEAGQATLFNNAITIITPTKTSLHHCIEKVTWLWESCGSHVTTMDPDKHDELMAIISHMPHLLSFVSMSIAGEIHIHKELLGAGFRDFTRIAASDPVMWKDIFMANKDHVLPLIDEYMEELGKIKGIISSENAGDLEEMLRTYATIRRDLYESTR